MDYNVFYRFPELVCVYLRVLLAIFTRRFDNEVREQLTLSLTCAFAVISSLTNMFVRTHIRQCHPRREARTRKLRQFA